MKIIHLIFSFNTGGSETMLVDIINEQVKTEIVYLIIVNDCINKELISKISSKVSILFINRQPASKNPFYFLKLNFLLMHILPDVIHCHNEKLIKVLLGYRKKTVLTIHAIGIVTENFKKYKKLFSISKAVFENVKMRSKLDSLIILNGIDINNIDVNNCDNINALEKRFKIVQVSRLDTQTKGQHLLIEAIYLLYKKGFKNFYVDFIGEGKSFNELRKLVTKYSLDENITFLGLRDRDYIYTHLKDYNLLVQPSLFEGFGLTVVEAMAAKIPVLVSDIDGPMEIIENGKYGYYFKANNPEHLAVQIQNVYEKIIAQEEREMVELAFDHVRMNFDISLTAKNYIDAYSFLS